MNQVGLENTVAMAKNEVAKWRHKFRTSSVEATAATIIGTLFIFATKPGATWAGVVGGVWLGIGAIDGYYAFRAYRTLVAAWRLWDTARAELAAFNRESGDRLIDGVLARNTFTSSGAYKAETPKDAA